jgi:purine-nucleoside/S-methyl-5'-thioadenosine phosphorylase / adenosine deaminase
MASNGFFAWGEHFAIDLPGARAVFTTRRGGFSSGPYAELNLGRLTDDRPEDVERNRASLEADLGRPLSYIRQVHGTHVRRVSTPTRPGPEVKEADGQATTSAELAVMVMVADCLPIALAGGGAVAMLHGGWRGLAGGIVEEGVRAVRELSPDAPDGPLAAAIGPGAGVCCYEVGEEVHEAFAGDGPDVRRGRNLDLKRIARRRLERAGVEVVHDIGLCTICGDPSLLFSHRRDGGITGRQAGIAWLS